MKLKIHTRNVKFNNVKIDPRAYSMPQRPEHIIMNIISLVQFFLKVTL